MAAYDVLAYNTNISTNAAALVNQYESAKWGIALTGPGNATGESGLTGTEAQQAMASTQAGATTDGYSVFSDKYLVRLSATSNIQLAASGNVTIDLQGDNMTLAAGRNLSITSTTGSISNNSSGTITTSQSAGSGGNITFSAGKDIALSGLTLNSNGGNIILDSNTAGSGGAISLTNSSALNSSGGNIILGGSEATPSNIVAGTGYAVGDATIGTNHYGGYSGVYINNATVNAGAGNIIVNGHGYDNTGSGSNTGIMLYGASAALQTSTGNITVNGIGGIIGSSQTDGDGVWVDTSAQITTVSGNISVTGTGVGTNGYASEGIIVARNAAIQATGNGNVTVIGTGGSGSQLDSGVYTNLNGTIGSGGSGTVSVTGVAGSGTTSYGIQDYSGNLTIGGSSATGNLTLTADSMSLNGGGTTSIQTTGNVTFQPYTASTAVDVATGSTGLQITSGIGSVLADTTAGSITIGNTSDTGTMTVGANTWTTPVSFLNGSGKIEFSGAQALGGNSLTAVSNSGNIQLDASATITSTASSGNPIVLAAGGNFVNNAGSSALAPGSGTARWIAYSTQLSSDTNGASQLNPAQVIAGQTYGSEAPGSVPNAGQNTWVYSAAGTITITATSQSVAYGSAIPTLTYGFSCSTGCGSGVMTGALAVNGQVAGTTVSHTNGFDVSGSPYTIVQGSLSDTNGYSITYNSASFAVTAKPITVTATSGQTVVYGSNIGTLTYSAPGVVAGDTLSGALTTAQGGAGTLASHANGLDVGNYAITQGTLTSGNNPDYTITYHLGSNNPHTN